MPVAARQGPGKTAGQARGSPVVDPPAPRRRPDALRARPAADSLLPGTLPGHAGPPPVPPAGPIWASPPGGPHGRCDRSGPRYPSDPEPVGLALQKDYNRSAGSTAPGLSGGTAHVTGGVDHALAGPAPGR